LRRIPKLRPIAIVGVVCCVIVILLWNERLFWRATKTLSIILPLSRVKYEYKNKPSEIGRVVVSMASFGERMGNLPRVISSLQNQTWKVDRIIINVPLVTRFGSMNRTDIQNMVDFLGGFLGKFTAESNTTFNHGIYCLNFLDHDFGPASKVLGALRLETDPDTTIVTVDDDCEYHPQTVESLVLHAPRHGALGAQCEELPRPVRVSATFFFGGAGQAPLFGGATIECFGWLMGYAGVAFRAGHFGPDVFKFLDAAPPGCFLHDDVWLSGYLRRRGVPRYFHAGVPEPRHFARHPTQSINSVDGTQARRPPLATDRPPPTARRPPPTAADFERRLSGLEGERVKG
jgi:hypothetical protein